jgi:hypothetical protein
MNLIGLSVLLRKRTRTVSTAVLADRLDDLGDDTLGVEVARGERLVGLSGGGKWKQGCDRDCGGAECMQRASSLILLFQGE